MPQTGHPDLEGGSNPDGHRSQHPSTPDRPLQPFQGEYDYSDSSWTVYSMYSKIAGDEDNKMVERCQRDADGTLIFTGLFSATVGALLTISFPDLKPNSQDTSAFYLQNIYQFQVFGNPNVSHPSVPSLAKPPAFSPPKYVIWVNSLWFLSLTVSLLGALVATLYRNWAVQYISITEPLWYTLTSRARMRALFAKEVPGPDIIWGTGYEPNLLHFSVLLFIVGSLIYLFNINRAVFYAVVWWVGWVTIYYTARTVGVFSEPHALFHTPLSEVALRIYLGASYAAFQVCSCIPPLRGLGDNIRSHYRDLSERYDDGILKGKRKQTEEIAFKPSSEVDTLILMQILVALDEDPALETFFDAIPGFCNSKLCILPLSSSVQTKFRQVLDGFLSRTFSSRLISESARVSRLITCLNAAHTALEPNAVSGILHKMFDWNWDQARQSVEIGHALRLWCHRRDHDLAIQRIIASIIARVRERDDRWTMLVKEEFGVPDNVLQDSLAHGDSVLLSILIHISREGSRVDFRTGILSSLSKFDIRNTLPGLQHDFCTLWNEIAQKAFNQGPYSTPDILHDIRHIYVALHQDTEAAPTTFSSSTDDFDRVLNQPSSYPVCNIASHRPDFTTHLPVAISGAVTPPTQPTGDSPDALPRQSTLDCGAARPLAEEISVILGLPSPPDSSTTSGIGEAPQAPTTTFPAHSNSHSSDRFPQDGAATARLDASSATVTVSTRPLESNDQQGPATPPVAPLSDKNETLSIVPTPAPAPEPATPVPNKLSATCDARPASASKPSFPSSGGFSTPNPPPPHAPPFPAPEVLSPLSVVSSNDPSDNTTPLRLPAHRLVINANVYLLNAVLQLFVYCPPFRDMFRDLSRLADQSKEDPDDCTTRLIDATAKFLDEFAYKEESSLTHQATRGKVKEHEEKKEDDGVHPFPPTDVYDAMKEKRQFIIMTDGRQQDSAVYLGLYLQALDEELVTLRSSISTHKLESSLKVKELKEGTRSGEGQTVGERDYTASSVESPVSHTFGGRSRSIVRAPNQPDTITVEDWRILQLNIQPDSVQAVEDALANISQPRPARPEIGQLSSSEVSQQMQIEALPSVLVLHLERFLYDATPDGEIKINKPVQFASELEIPLEMMASITGRSAESAHYKLYGVLYHHGESTSGGHYTVDVLHKNGDNGGGETWLHIDDGAVSTVRHEDVFGGHGSERIEGGCAKMLVYCRAALTQT